MRKNPPPQSHAAMRVSIRALATVHGGVNWTPWKKRKPTPQTQGTPYAETAQGPQPITEKFDYDKKKKEFENWKPNQEPLMTPAQGPEEPLSSVASASNSPAEYRSWADGL